MDNKPHSPSDGAFSSEIVLDGTPNAVKTFLFFAVCIAWLIPGLFGHDPWKYEEAVSLGVIQEMVWHGHWLSPQIAGEAYTARPPFFYWLGAALVRLLIGWMAPHDAARIASGLCMVMTFYAISSASKALFGSRHARLAVLLLLGCIGLVMRAHEINPDLGFLAGYALALWGVAHARATERDRELASFGIAPDLRGGVLWAGVLSGCGIALSYLSRGGLALGMTLPLVAWVTWRRRSQLSTIAPLLLPALGIPIICIGFWMWAASGLPYGGGSADPSWFGAWWHDSGSRVLDPLRWIDAEADPSFYLALLCWYGWPVAPLALWASWDAWRGRLGGVDLSLPAVAFLVGLVCVGLGTAPREASTLPLLLPLTLLAVAGVDHLRRGAASFLDWFGSMTFGLFCSLLWLAWVAQLTGQPADIVAYLDKQLPNYQAHFHLGSFLFAGSITLLWIVAVAKSRQNPRRAVLNWAVGLTTLWLLIMTLWLPYVDESRSYRKPFIALAGALPTDHGCVASTGLGLPQRALLEYFSGLHTERTELYRGQSCGYLIRQVAQRDRAHLSMPGAVLWEGTRPGDREEWFQLIRMP